MCSESRSVMEMRRMECGDVCSKSRSVMETSSRSVGTCVARAEV